jgi:hypothetical protein
MIQRLLPFGNILLLLIRNVSRIPVRWFQGSQLTVASAMGYNAALDARSNAQHMVCCCCAASFALHSAVFNFAYRLVFFVAVSFIKRMVRALRLVCRMLLVARY